MINAESLPQLPRRQRIIITILFFIITLFLSLIVINKVATELIVSLNKEEIQATVIKKYTTRGKSGTSYFYSYQFEVGNTQYVRPLFLGLLTSDTKINKTDYDSIETDSMVSVFYCKMAPQFNFPQNDPYKNEKLFFIIAGILLFGMMFINETKTLLKNKNQIA
jgi:hypothetical protein